MQLYPHASVLAGIDKLTKHLASCGVPMAIATSSSRAAVNAKRVNHEPLFKRFGAIITAEDITRGKPHPDVFLTAASALNLAPRDCAVFEDAESGVLAGVAAGCVVIAAPDRRLFPADEPLPSGFCDADEVLTSLDEFVPEAWGFPPYSRGKAHS